MTHDRVRRRLSRYLEGDLAADECTRLKHHLVACPACTQELRAMRRTLELLREIPEPEPPADLAEVVIARLRAGEGAPGWWSRLTRWRPTPVSWLTPAVTATAALAVMLVADVDLSWPGRGDAQIPAVADRTTTPRMSRSTPIVASAEPGARSIATVVSPPTARAGRDLPLGPATAVPAIVEACLRDGRSQEDCARFNAWRLVGLGREDTDLFLHEMETLPDREVWLRRVRDFAHRSGSAPLLANQLRARPHPRASTVALQLEDPTPLE